MTTKFSAYCYSVLVINDVNGVPVQTVKVCPFYQGIVGLQDGICTKLNVPIEDYCKECNGDVENA
jgi:hypothetical protein